MNNRIQSALTAGKNLAKLLYKLAKQVFQLIKGASSKEKPKNSAHDDQNENQQFSEKDDRAADREEQGQGQGQKQEKKKETALEKFLTFLLRQIAGVNDPNRNQNEEHSNLQAFAQAVRDARNSRSMIRSRQQSINPEIPNTPAINPDITNTPAIRSEIANINRSTTANSKLDLAQIRTLAQTADGGYSSYGGDIYKEMEYYQSQLAKRGQEDSPRRNPQTLGESDDHYRNYLRTVEAEHQKENQWRAQQYEQGIGATHKQKLAEAQVVTRALELGSNRMDELTEGDQKRFRSFAEDVLKTPEMRAQYAPILANALDAPQNELFKHIGNAIEAREAQTLPQRRQDALNYDGDRNTSPDPELERKVKSIELSTVSPQRKREALNELADSRMAPRPPKFGQSSSPLLDAPITQSEQEVLQPPLTPIRRMSSNNPQLVLPDKGKNENYTAEEVWKTVGKSTVFLVEEIDHERGTMRIRPDTSINNNTNSRFVHGNDLKFPITVDISQNPNLLRDLAGSRQITINPPSSNRSDGSIAKGNAVSAQQGRSRSNSLENDPSTSRAAGAGRTGGRRL